MNNLCSKLSRDDDYLDFQILSDYHDVVYNHTISLILGKNVNMYYAIFMRMLSALKYLNAHPNSPDNYEEMLLFICYSSMIIDAVNLLHSDLGIPLKDNSCVYFKDIWRQPPFNLSSDYPNDNEFFKYFRSVVMAHPFDTNRIKSLKEKKATHYSPNAIVSTGLMKRSKPDVIGVKIYSSESENVYFLQIEFQNLKSFIKSRYELFNNVIQCLLKRVEVSA